jgi:hypothetical protein
VERPDQREVSAAGVLIQITRSSPAWNDVLWKTVEEIV